MTVWLLAVDSYWPITRHYAFATKAAAEAQETRLKRTRKVNRTEIKRLKIRGAK